MHTLSGKIVRVSAAAALLLLSTVAVVVRADDRTEYNARAAARDLRLFKSLDLNADGVLTLAEAKGDLDLGPRFDDIDLNRDGRITGEELKRYIEQRYGVTSTTLAAPPK